VQDHLSALEKKQCIARISEKKRSRNIKILQTKHGEQEVGIALRVPIVGSVAAGKPILSEENIESYVSIAAAGLTPGKNYFILRVKGTSMIEAGIFDGDLALIEQRQSIENGQIAVVELENGLTLKKIYLMPTKIKLVAANAQFPTQYFNNVHIAGVLVRIMREY